MSQSDREIKLLNLHSVSYCLMLTGNREGCPCNILFLMQNGTIYDILSKFSRSSFYKPTFLRFVDYEIGSFRGIIG